MVPRWLVVVVAACAACGPEETTYPPLSTLPDCHTHPHLCGLPLTDLGGGEHDNAFDIVFVGDGFLAEDDFAGVVDRLVSSVAADAAGPVSFDVDLFHFWRVDLDSRSREVANDDLSDTPLAAHLRQGDSCQLPFIDVDRPRSHLAVRAAQDPTAPTKREDGPLADDLERGFVHVVNVVHNIVGRANADIDVRMSSLDGPETLRHELGHALFELADEYAEFDSCPIDAAIAGVAATDGDLVTAPNIQRSSHPAKWAGLYNDSLTGGSRLPCLHHATDCLMEGTSSSWCAVCEAAIAERLDLQRCGNDDREPPRVAIDAPLSQPDFVLLPGDSRIAVRAVADDTRDSSRGRDLEIEWVRGSDVIARGALATIDLVDLEPDAEVFARATDAQGNVGVSRPLQLDGAFPRAIVNDASAFDGNDDNDTVGLVALDVQMRPGTRVHLASSVDAAEVKATGPQFFLGLGVPLRNDGDGGVVVTAVATSADGRLTGPAESFVIPRVEKSLPATENTLQLAAVGFAPVESDDVLFLAETTTLELRVSGCTAVESAGLVVDGAVYAVAVSGREQPLCGASAGHIAVDFELKRDGIERSVIEPFAIDIAGRVTRGPRARVRSVDLSACGLEPVLHVGTSAFDGARVDLIGADVPIGGVDDVFVDVVAFRSGGVGQLAFNTGRGTSFFPVDLDPGDRTTTAHLAARIVCPSVVDAVVFARFDVDIAGLPRVDRTPPIIVSSLHRRGDAEVLVADDGPLDRLTLKSAERAEDIDADGETTMQFDVDVTVDGNIVVATDGAGLAAHAVVSAPSLSLPRVPLCR
jgi:hypothetical protein